MGLYKNCLACQQPLKGRKDKKFCDDYCRSSYHYQLRTNGESSFYLKVHQQLTTNRKILKAHIKAGKVMVNQHVLTKLGFNPNFFTHYWKNRQGDVYLFVYEFGFLTLNQNNKKKYLLILWQDYMGKNLPR